MHILTVGRYRYLLGTVFKRAFPTNDRPRRRVPGTASIRRSLWTCTLYCVIGHDRREERFEVREFIHIPIPILEAIAMSRVHMC